MKNKLQISFATYLIIFTSVSFAQVGIFGTDSNGNTTEKCSNEGWDKSECSLTKINVGNILPDKKETNCQGESRTIYKTLEDGKPLFFIVEAWGCPPCWAGAPEKAEYIQSKKSIINFWIPLCEYFGNEVVCSTSNKFDQRSIEGWQNSHPGLKGAFMFTDNDRTYNLVGIPAQPGYGVVDPKTKKLVYSGYDYERAKSIAENLAKESPTANLNNESVKQFSFAPNPAQNNVTIKSNKNQNNIALTTLDGRQVFNLQSNEYETTVDVSDLQKGMYILKVNNQASQLVVE